MLRATLRAKLQRAMGHGSTPAESELIRSNDWLDDHLDEALRELNRYWPKVNVASFDTEAGVQAYQPVDPDVGTVTDAWWSTAATVPDLQDLGVVEDEAGNLSFPEPRLMAILARIDSWARLASGSATILDGWIYLDPVPAEAGVKVWFRWTGDRYATVEDVPERGDRWKAYWAKAQELGHRALSVGTGAIQSFRSAGGAGLTTAAPVNHPEEARRCLAEFQAAIPPWLPGKV